METFATVIISVIASSGIATVIMKFIVESALREAHQKKKMEQERREERYKLEDEWVHEVGRVLFWIYHGIKMYEKESGKEYWNGDLEKSMSDMQATEKRRKELDRTQLAEVNDN